MMTPNPTCELECRFSTSFGMTTMMYYPPVYDKHGVNLNPDMNSTSTTVNCSVCNKSWSSITRAGVSTFDEIL
jgi:hypothetical protein